MNAELTGEFDHLRVSPDGSRLFIYIQEYDPINKDVTEKWLVYK